jgi:hypothetical protein
MGGHCSVQEAFMFRFKFAISAAVATLALGGASAMAMQSNSGGGHPDNHGAVVSSAARTTCHTAASGTHGQCVSAIASTNGQAHRNGDGAQKVRDCRAQGFTGRDFGACVSGHPKHDNSTKAHEAGDSDDADEAGETS